MMNVLFAASECAPFIKTGGLGDVIGALPKVLSQKGQNVSVVLPNYNDLPNEYKEQLEFVCDLEVPVGWRMQYCGVFRLEHDGLTYYFLDNEYYFKRHGSYGYYDDGERFAFFSRAILECLPYLDIRPDLIHSHDWQTGLISVLLKAHFRNHPFYKGIKTVFTIHNLRYQGVFPKNVLSELLDLSDLYFNQEGLEFYGNVSYLKAGLAYSDYLTTVSETYAEEIQCAYYGEQLDGFLRMKNHQLVGIINGIDQESYNPETDPQLFQNFNSFDGKQENKRQLQKELGLAEQADIPVLSMVTRLVDQKGVDLLTGVIHEIMALDVQLVILGTGESQYENTLKALADQYQGQFVFCCFFDDGLARKIYGGSDLFLMPSKFEPCGIGQLLAFRYGTLPLVRETGGLKDTVQPYNELTGEGTGFSFKNYNAHELLHTIEFAIWIYRLQPEKWRALVEQALTLDFSWEQSATQYISLYNKLLEVEQTLNLKR